AQKKDAAKTCELLKRSFDGGFLDMAHVGRDVDLDPIRDDVAFKKLVADTRKKILDGRAKPRRLVPRAAATGKRALLVYLARNGSAANELEDKIAAVVESVACVALVETGHGGSAWDSTAETCVAADVEEALGDAALALDPERVVIAGDLDGARLAVAI